MPSRGFGALIGSLVLAGAWLALAELGMDDALRVNSYQVWPALGIVGGLLGWGGRLRWPVAFAGVGFGALLLIQWLPWPATLSRGLVRADSLPAGPVDAIVVLSASMTDEGVLGPVGATRLLEGVRLLRAGAAPRLVVSRITRLDETPNPVDSDRDQRALLSVAGLTPELHVLGPVGSTHDEALRMAELAAPRGWRRVVVVTSPLHSRRACATFEAAGLEVVCRPSPERGFALGVLGAGGDRSRAFGEWLYESLGWWKYRIRGWVRS